MENIIFLDIDGVLNDNDIGGSFNEESVIVVKELIKMYNAKVVMITSLQGNGTANRRRYFQQRCEQYGIYDVDFIDPNFRGSLYFDRSSFSIEIAPRLLGIIDYLKSNQVSNYVILDDDYHKAYKQICLNHYRTRTYVGLTHKDLSKIKLKPVNLNNFRGINYEYRQLGEYESVTNNLIKVLKKRYEMVSNKDVKR